MLSLKEIREKYQSPWYEKKKINNIFSRYFYTAIATVLVKFILPTKITANQITVSWVILGFLGCLLFTAGNYWVSILAVLVIQLHVVLDYVDGPIARARNKKSFKGIYIERVGHDLIYTIYFFCIAVGSLRQGFDPALILVLGFCASTGGFFYKHTRRAKVYCALTSKKNMPENGAALEGQAGNMKVFTKHKPSFARRIYRSSLIIWEPVFFTAVSLVLAIFDRLYFLPIFYGLTYPLHFVLSYIYQARMLDKEVDRLADMTGD